MQAFVSHVRGIFMGKLWEGYSEIGGGIILFLGKFDGLIFRKPRFS